MPTLSQSANRVIKIMELFAQYPNGLRVAEVARLLHLNRTTAHRLMSTLAKNSWVTRLGENSDFRLGPAFLALCQQSLSKQNLLSILQPIAEQLSAVSGETTHIGVVTNHKLIHVLHARCTRQIGIASEVGAVDELYCTALGKVLLASCSEEYLEEYLNTNARAPRTSNTIVDRAAFVEEIARVRAREYALDCEESSPGVICLAVRISGNTPETVIAMSTTGPSSRFPLARAKALAPKALELARRAAQNLMGTETSSLSGGAQTLRQSFRKGKAHPEGSGRNV